MTSHSPIRIGCDLARASAEFRIGLDVWAGASAAMKRRLGRTLRSVAITSAVTSGRLKTISRTGTSKAIRRAIFSSGEERKSLNFQCMGRLRCPVFSSAGLKVCPKEVKIINGVPANAGSAGIVRANIQPSIFAVGEIAVFAGDLDHPVQRNVFDDFELSHLSLRCSGMRGTHSIAHNIF